MIIRTKILDSYVVKFITRILIFGGVLSYYLLHREVLVQAMNSNFFDGLLDGQFTILHLLWIIFMPMMIQHLLLPKNFTYALLKSKGSRYEPISYAPQRLEKKMEHLNRGAWRVAISWLLLNGLVATLYFMHILDRADLLMISVFYFLSDYICILLWCPFQTYLMRNKCCVNCRIFDWGHIMMFTPMALIPSFYSLSLFFVSLIVFVRWEIGVARHPERYWEGSNNRLKCKNCQDKTCQFKKMILKSVK